jgi:drug/metabolite transporter (DMT)-like permease
VTAALLYIFLCLVWGSTWLFIRIGLKDLSPFWSLSLRILPALLFILALAFIWRTPLRVAQAERRAILKVALIVYPVGYGLVYWGEQYVSSGLAAVVFSTMPFFVALLSWRLLPGERPGLASVIGLVLGFLGLVAVYWEELAMGDLQKVAGMAALSFSSFLSAYTTIVVRRDLGRVAPVALTAYTLLAGAVIVPAYALVWEGTQGLHFTGRALAAAAYLSVVASGLAFVAYYHLLTSISALTMSLIAFVTPLVALVLGTLFDYDELGPRALVGITLVLAGVFVAARVSHPSRKAGPA